MAGLGFKPAARVDCRPRFRRSAQLKNKPRSLGTSSAYCEMEVLFVRADRDPASISDVYWQYHHVGHHGCEAIYPANRTKELVARPPPGRAVFVFGGQGTRFFGTGRTSRLFDRRLKAPYSIWSYGMPYVCSDALFGEQAAGVPS